MSAHEKSPPNDPTPRNPTRHLADNTPSPAKDDGRFAPNEPLYERPFGGRSGAYGRNEDYEVNRDKSAGGHGPANKKPTEPKSKQ